MRPPAGAVLRLLEDERTYPPLSLEKITFCLKVTGQAGHELKVADVEAALSGLMLEGKVEAVYSMRLGKRYRLIQAVRPVAARGTDRPLPSPSGAGDR